MDVKLLEYMIAIADCGNITKAAESLFITQSGLNQQLIRLENELNTQLFYRTKRHLHLTQAGKIYIDNAREILKIKKNTYTTIQDLTDGTVGEISFGIPKEIICLFTFPLNLIKSILASLSIWLSALFISSSLWLRPDSWIWLLLC